MKLIIDNANIDDIRSMYEYFPMDGVTCNPTILAKEKRPPYEVLKEIRDFIEEGELHVQVLSDEAEGDPQGAGKRYVCQDSHHEGGLKGHPDSRGGRHQRDGHGHLYADAGVSGSQVGSTLCGALYQPD